MSFFALPASESEKHFQNLRVSSAAAYTTVVPSGDCAMCKTLAL